MSMDVLIIKHKAAKEEIKSMLATLSHYIKLAVDIKRSILAGGGILHADCEAVLLKDGSKQEDIWGADWILSNKMVRFEALINIAPRRNNPSMEIKSPEIRKRVETVIRNLLDHS